MSTITVAQDIEDARERLTLPFESLRQDQTANFWEAFGAAAARYRAARSEGPAARDFAGVVQELKRDAAGTASNPKYVRGAPVPAEYPLPSPSRAPWATMPTDGSGRLTLAERVTYSLIGAASVAALLIMAWVAGMFGSSPDAPPAPSLTSYAAEARDGDAAMITRGAYWSWEAYTECGNGPAACDAVLREVNREAHAYGLHVWEDGSVSPL